MVWGILLTLFLVALNAFFVAAEFSIVKVRDSQLELRAKAGHAISKVALSITKNLDAYLSACQLGITLASLGLGWIGEQVIAELLRDLFQMAELGWSENIVHAIAIPLAFSLITFLHIVYGELAPKTIAIRYAASTTLAIALPLRGFYLVFRPVINLFNGFANFSIRLFGIPPVVGHDVHTQDELRLLLRQSRDVGKLPTDEHALLERVFRFNDRVVRQAMVPRSRMVAVEVTSSVEQLLERVLAEGYSRFPVFEGNRDRIIGIAHSKDLLRASKTPDFSIRDVLHLAIFVSETQSLKNLLREMQQKKAQMAIVVDEYGSTVGIITMEDIVEELVGEIQDEYDEEPSPVEKKNDSEFIIDAGASISDINLHLPVPIPEDPDCDSMAGLLVKLVGGIPKPNQIFRIGAYDVAVLETTPRRVRRAALTLTREPLEASI